MDGCNGGNARSGNQKVERGTKKTPNSPVVVMTFYARHRAWLAVMVPKGQAKFACFYPVISPRLDSRTFFYALPIDIPARRNTVEIRP